MKGMTFDQVERYRGAAMIVGEIRRSMGETVQQVLDIGGFFRTLAGEPLLPGPLMISDCDCTVVDIEPADVPGYRRMDPEKPLPFEDRAFPVTICMDVLEHMPPGRRLAFVEDALRVTSGVLILGAPFQHPDRVAADRWLAGFLDTVLGEPNPMLDEHIRNGLPDAALLQLALDAAGCRYLSFPNGDLGMWRLVMAVKHLVLLARGPDPSMRFEFDMLPWAEPVCTVEPGYRDMFIIVRNREWDAETLFEAVRTRLQSEVTRIGEQSGAEAAAVMGRWLEPVGNTIAELGRIRIRQRVEELRLQGALASQQAISDEMAVMIREQAMELHRRGLKIEELERHLVVFKDVMTHIAEYDRGMTELKQSAAFRTGRIVLAPVKAAAGLLKRKSPDTPAASEIVPAIQPEWSPGMEAPDAAGPDAKGSGETDRWRTDPDIGGFDHRFVFSILVPVYNTEERVFRAMLDSVLAQTYPLWQLCLADDASPDDRPRQIIKEYAEREPERIRFVFSDTNGGIAAATNRAASLATGEFICLLDHDDLLDPGALMVVALQVHRTPDADFIYSDEDKVSHDGQTFSQAYFKPDFDPELLMCNNYLNHFSVIRAQLFRETGGYREGFDGSQDYDLYLRVTEKARRIVHIPRILYHWRMVPDSTAADPEAKGGLFRESSFRALREMIGRRGLDATVEPGLSPGSYRVRHRVTENGKVCIIIPTRNEVDMLELCLASIRRHTGYADYEIMVVDNNSDDPVLGLMVNRQQREHRNTRMVHCPGRFNFSHINNVAVNKTKAEYLLFMNNDIEVSNDGWMEAMLEYAQYSEIGAVGAKLLYPDGRIQHVGVMLGMGGVAGHPFKGMPDHNGAYFGHSDMIKNYSAVTAACMMVRREVFDVVGGFNEELAVSFGDIDLCMEIRRHGYRIVYTPYARLIHHESASRKDDNEMPRRPRFHAEITYMISKWGKTLYSDPYLNPNLSILKYDLSPRDPEEDKALDGFRNAFRGFIPGMADEP